MLQDLVFLDSLWDALAFAPSILGILGGGLLALGLFGVRGWQPSCRGCRHDLRAVPLEGPNARCPECGRDLTTRNAVRAGRMTVRWGRVLGGLLCIGLGLAPLVGGSPASLRFGLARTLPPAGIYAEHLAGDRFASTIHMLRMSDAAYTEAVVDEVMRLYAAAPANWPNERPLMDLLDIMRNRTTADEPGASPELRLAQRFAAAAEEESGTHAARAALLAQLLLAKGDDRVIRTLVQSESLVPHWITVQLPKTALVGEDISFRASFSAGLLTSRMRLEPRVRSVRSRAQAAAPWTDVPLRQEFQGPTMTATDAGPLELELTVELALPLEPGQTPTDRVVVTSTFLRGIEVVSPDSFTITPVTGSEARAALEPTLRELRLANRGSMITLETPRGGRPRGNGDDDLRYGGRMIVRAGPAEGLLGTFFYDLRGSGGGGFGGGKRLDPNSLAGAKRITLRIEPDAEGLRGSLREHVRYVNELIELDFDGLDMPPTAVRWIDRGPK